MKTRCAWTSALLLVAAAACGKTSSSPPASSTQSTTAAPAASPTSAVPDAIAPRAMAPCVPSPAVADVHATASVGGGFGAELEALFIDGSRAVLVVREASVEGAPIGAFEACLRDEDVRALEPLARAAAAAGERLQRDAGVFSFRLQTRERTIEVRTPLPPSSAAGSALVREVDRWLVAARSNPLQAVRLELAPPDGSLVLGRPATYKLRLVNVGSAPLTVSFPAEGPWLEATDVPLEAPTWAAVTEKAKSLGRIALAAGASSEIPMIVKHDVAKKLAVWARFEGRIELAGVPHAESAFFTRMMSKPLMVEVRPR